MKRSPRRENQGATLVEFLGLVIRSARYEAKLSQAEIATRAGCSQIVITRLETGRSVPILDRLVAIFDACNRSLGAALVEWEAFEARDVAGRTAMVAELEARPEPLTREGWWCSRCDAPPIGIAVPGARALCVVCGGRLELVPTEDETNEESGEA